MERRVRDPFFSLSSESKVWTIDLFPNVPRSNRHRVSYQAISMNTVNYPYLQSVPKVGPGSRTKVARTDKFFIPRVQLLI